MRARRAIAALLAGAVVLAALPAFAAPFTDPKTGFSVDPPDPFIVGAAKTQTYDLAVVVNSTNGKPSLGVGNNYLCQIGYKAEPDNADFTQEDINLQTSAPDWLDAVAEQMSQSFTVTGKTTFVTHGATGIEIVGKPKDATHSAGLFISMVDTPAGRTTVSCATRAEEFDAALNQFRLIRAGVVPPGTADAVTSSGDTQAAPSGPVTPTTPAN